MNWLGQALTFQGRDDQADEWLEKAYALDPFNGGVATNMANQVWKDGNPERGEWILSRLAGLPEPNLLAIYMLSEFYRDTGRLIEANRTAKRLMLAGE